MKYDYVVKYNGVYYDAGEDIPIGVKSQMRDTEDNMELPFSDKEIQMESEPHVYTYEELEQMTAKQMRRIAEDKGFRLMKATKDDLINEFLSKQ